MNLIDFRILKSKTAVFSLLFLVFLFHDTTQAAPGDLDPTFGNDGKVLIPFGNFDGRIGSIITQNDGKIILASYTYNNSTNDFTVTRYNPNGTVDTGFGNQGVVITPVGISEDKAYSVVLQSDGKIIVVGTVWTGLEEFGVVRYDQNGTLDNSFNGSGKVITDVTNNVSNDSAYSAQIQSDGKILLGGTCANRFCLVRYNTDGSLDTSFDGDGKVLTPTTLIEERAVSLTLQSDGKIVMVGSARQDNGDYEFLTARYNTDGSLDSTFDSDGKAMTPINGFLEYATAVTMQPNGKIVVAGYSYRRGNPLRPDVFTDYDVAIIRYNPDGSLDSTFDSDGKTTIRFGKDDDLFDDYANAVSLQQNGKILVSGYRWNGSKNNFTIARFNQNGLLDSSFGTNGKIITAIGDVDDKSFSMALQNDGKILVGGRSYIQNNHHFVVVRYIGDQLEVIRKNPYDFDGDGKSDISVFRPSLGSWYLLQSSNSSFLGISFGLGSDVIAPADYDGDSKTDFAVFRPDNGSWYLQQSANGFTGVQFGQNGDIPVPADYDGDGKDDIAVYRPSTGGWYRLNSSNGGFVAVAFGTAEDKPTIGDFDGDGKADIAVFRPSTANWFRLNSSNNQFVAVPFGAADDKLTPADFDGDGKTDIAVYRPSTGGWYRLNSTNGEFVAVSFGISEDQPVAADYDGDGKADVAVFRPSDSNWYLLRSTAGFTAVQFGQANDKPVPNAFVR